MSEHENGLDDPPGIGAAGRLVVDDLPRGASIGRYLVVERLGAGGMGVVYSAYDPELNRKVAIKLLRNQPGTMASEGQARLLREAQAMARLSSPHVVAVYDVGMAFNQVFVAMEFVEGGTLTGWLRFPRTTAEILQMFADAGQGLAAAHAGGIIHRDFKPDNVMISRAGRAKVTDFGVARDIGQPLSDPSQLARPSEITNHRTGAAEPSVSGNRTNPTTPNPADASRPPAPSAASGAEMGLDRTVPEFEPSGAALVNSPLTKEGALVGTPRYMSPEQFRGEPSDARSDQFSFCVALYETVCGHPPFAGDSLGELAYAVCHGHVRPFAADKKVPSWLRAVLGRGLQVRPEHRYPTLVALLEELSPERRRRRRKRLAWFTSLSSLVLIAVVGVAAHHGRQRLKAQLCETVDAELQSVFGEEARQKAQQGLLRTNRPYAAQVFAEVEHNVRDYLDEWRAVRRDTCQATFVLGKQTPELHKRRLRCLDARLQDVAAFMNLLKTADEQVLDSAADQSSDLSLLEPCSDPHYLSQLVSEKHSERETLDLLARELSHARLLRNAGRIKPAKERTLHVLASAQQLSDLPLAAQAERQLSTIEHSVGNPILAHQRALSAAALGIKGGDYLTAAWAFSDLLFLSQGMQRDLVSDKWQTFAEVALSKVKGSAQAKARIAATLDLYLCQQLSAQQQKARAEAQCQRALHENERVFGANSSQMGTVLNSLALHKKRQEQYAQAEALYRRALQIEQAHHSGEHPRLLTILENLGVLLELENQPVLAEAEYRRALQIGERVFGPKHPRLCGPLRQLTLLKLKQGQAEAALPIAERLRDLSDGTPRAVASRLLLGHVLQKLGRFALALPLHRESLAACQQNPCADLGARLLATAQDLLELGNPTQAQPLLEQALHGQSGGPVAMDAETQAKVERLLAELLWNHQPKNPARIQSLGEQAYARLTDLGLAQPAAEWCAWLRQRRLRPSCPQYPK